MLNTFQTFGAVFFLCCLLVGRPAFADIYETIIDIDNEDDLYEMASRQEISDETLQTLLELLRDGVNLTSANRDELYILPNLTYADVDAILEYRQAKGSIVDPAELVAAGALTADQLKQIAAFLVLEPVSQKWPLGGRLRLVGATSASDTEAPPAFAQMRLKGPQDTSAGFAVATTRQRLGEVTFDETRNALLAEGAAYRFQLPKLYAQWKTSNAKVLVGTFRLGFAQRLVLDNTTRRTPNGIIGDDVMFLRNELSSNCRLSKGELDDSPCEESGYVAADFLWREGFRGIAGTLENVGPFTFHGFASYQTKSVYQYELYDSGNCADPRDPTCSAPSVFLKQDDISAPAPKVSYSTLPNIYNEWAFGGHTEWKMSAASALGLTGYFARPEFNVEGVQLDFQEWSRIPSGGPFGAVGLNGQFTFGDFTVYAEGARSFDSMPNGRGGGLGGIIRNVYSANKQEWELALRYYDKGFANPYARPISAPDEFEGQRARNEAGALLRFVSKLPMDFRLRGLVDFWVWPEDGAARETAGMPSVSSELRGDFLGWAFFQPGLWVEYRNKDLTQNNRGECFSLATESNDFGEPLPCFGEFYRVGARMKFEPWRRKLALTVQYMRDWLDDARHPNDFRQDSVFWVEVTSWATDTLRLRARIRHYFDDVSDNTYLEQSWWSQADVTWKASKAANFRLRYDAFLLTDERASTLTRNPNPEHRFRLEWESRF